MTKRMTNLAVAAALTLIAGCSLFNGYFNADSSKGSQASSQQEYYVRVWMDNHECERGASFCEISSPVSTRPKVKYEITEADKMGRLNSVIINIFREFDGGWASKADFIVTAKNASDPEGQMKTGKVYSLGAKSDALNFMDGNGNVLDEIKLEPGMKYLMNFVVSADRSETVGVVFNAR